MSYNKDNDYFMRRFNEECQKQQDAVDRKKMERANKAIFLGFGGALLVVVIFKVIESL